MSTGLVTTLAGTPATIGAADGVASIALFHSPASVAIDASGIFGLISDQQNNVIRRVEIASPVTTTPNPTASPATPTPSLPATPSVGPPSVDATTTYAVSTIAGTAGLAGYADGSAALFSNPVGLAWGPDASYVLIVDTGNNVIRQFNVSTAVVTTIAGSGTFGSNNGVGTSASFLVGSFGGIVVNAGGGLAFIAEYGSSVIRLLNLQSRLVSTIAGRTYFLSSVDGIGTAASFSGPAGIALDAASSFALIVS